MDAGPIWFSPGTPCNRTAMPVKRSGKPVQRLQGFPASRVAPPLFPCLRWPSLPESRHGLKAISTPKAFFGFDLPRLGVTMRRLTRLCEQTAGLRVRAAQTGRTALTGNSGVFGFPAVRSRSRPPQGKRSERRRLLILACCAASFPQASGRVVPYQGFILEIQYQKSIQEGVGVVDPGRRTCRPLSVGVVDPPKMLPTGRSSTFKRGCARRAS